MNATFSNPTNRDRRVDVIVSSVGSSGTITGSFRFLKNVKRKLITRSRMG
jgi:cysteine synthase